MTSSRLGVADRDLTEDAAVVSAADCADIVRRESLEQPLADNRVEKSCTRSGQADDYFSTYR